MRKTIEILDGLATFLLDDLELVDPEVNVQYDAFTFTVAKELAGSLSNALFTGELVSITMESLGAGGVGCIERRVGHECMTRML